MKFTISQREAIAAFKGFLEGDTQVLILKGAAGTGKTTVVSEFLRILEARNEKYMLMAPTGRAAYILGNKTRREASTIHRSIYSLSELKSTGEDEGNLHFRFDVTDSLESSTRIFIVDESSMLSDAFYDNEAFLFGSGCLLTDLFRFSNGRKMVFIGDYAQLPPVGMDFSPALDREYVEDKFACAVEEIVLREVVRQSSQGSMLCNVTKIRDSIERKTFVEFKLEEGIDSVAENVFLLKPYFELSPQKPCVKAAVITHSNKQALEYNLAIRRHYFGDGAPRLRSGDLLIVCRNNYSYDYELFNGNIVKVEACQPDEDVEKRQVRVKSGNQIETVELRFRKVTLRFAVNGKAVSLNVMILDNFLDSPKGALSGLLVRALIVDFNNRLPAELRGRANEIRRWLKSKQELTVEQRELCMAYLGLLKDDLYYNSVICKYGYALTCHKAQGGEWDNVFVDMCRFGSTATEDYFRWAYTALTRASKKVWHFRSPDFNYISNLVVEEIMPATPTEVSSSELSYIPAEAPFTAPGRPFAEKLVAFIRSQLDETGIELVGISQESGLDVFHLKTDGIARMALAYTEKGNYTYMRLASTLGPLDKKLQALRAKFI